MELTNNLGDVMGTSADLVRPQLDVRLHSRVLELPTDETLGIEHGVDGVHCHLIVEEGRQRHTTRLGYNADTARLPWE